VYCIYTCVVVNDCQLCNAYTVQSELSANELCVRCVRVLRHKAVVYSVCPAVNLRCLVRVCLQPSVNVLLTVSGFFAPLPFRPLDDSPPGSFASWLVCPLADSPTHLGRPNNSELTSNITGLSHLFQPFTHRLGFLSSYRNDTTYGGERARGRIV